MRLQNSLSFRWNRLGKQPQRLAALNKNCLKMNTLIKGVLFKKLDWVLLMIQIMRRLKNLETTYKMPEDKLEMTTW
jgi:hypothetical protein